MVKEAAVKRNAFAVLFVVTIVLGGMAGVAYSQEDSSIIPNWIKNLFMFWGDGQVGDAELINAIGFLVDEGVIKTEQSNTIESLEEDLAKLQQENEDLKAENAELMGVPDEQRMYGPISAQTASPVLGSSTAGVTIVEFGDYQCPKCKAWFDNTKPSIYEDYIETGKANMIFVDFVFLGVNSQSAAEASYCAEDQGMYWEYHDILYQSQGSFGGDWASVDNLKEFAATLNLDEADFAECLDSGKYLERVANNKLVATDYGISSTPSFVIVPSDGEAKTIVGAQPYSVFQSVLDSLT